MKTKLGFVPELTLPRVERVRDFLVTQGLPVEKYAWLSDALLSSGCLPDDEDAFETVRQISVTAFTHWKDRSDSDGTILAMLEAIRYHMSRLRGVTLYQHSTQRSEWVITSEACTKFIKTCVAEGVDFTNAFESHARLEASGSESTEKSTHFRLLETAQWLHREGLLVPERLCDLSRLEGLADLANARSGDLLSAETDHKCDVRSPMFWMEVGAEPFLRCLMPALESMDDEAGSRFALDVVHVTLWTIRMGYVTSSYDHRPDLKIRQTVFQYLDNRVGPESRKATPALRHAWIRISQMVQGGNVSLFDAACLPRLKEAADFELGRLRSEMRSPLYEGSVERFNASLPIIEASTDILFAHSLLWDAMRPLLLMFRELKAPAVAPDMRYWSDAWHRPVAPLPWSRIPEALVGSFHAMAYTEQEHDPDLTDLRSRFGRFCLERLKSKSAGAPPIEPDSRWRWAYIRAARELRINPEGKGHHILNYAVQSDPDTDVRDEAKAAYTEMRHGPTLPAGLSPRRTVTNALIWLFQAHYLCVAPTSVPMDENGVQRTREEIARRTMEPKMRSGVEPNDP
jgi:hypothetical protein